MSFVNIIKPALKIIPWKEIAKTLAMIAAGAIGDEFTNRFNNRPKKPTDKSGVIDLQSLNQKIIDVEQEIAENEKYLNKLEKQQKVISEIVSTLTARMLLLTIGVIASVVISISALIILLLRH